MSLLINASASQWDFSTPEKGNLSMKEAGWYLQEDKSGIWTKTPNATVSLVFQGTAIYLYSTRSPQGGRMNITCDWDKPKIVSLDAPEEPGWRVWSRTDMSSTVQHAIKVQMLDGEEINIDHVGIEPGEYSPFPPTVPNPIPPAFPARFLSVSTTTSASAMTVTTTTTMTMIATMTATPGSSSSISLSKGAVAGIAVGLVALSFSAAFLLVWCCRNRDRRNGYTAPGSPHSGIKGLSLPRWVRQGGFSSPRKSGPRFTQIGDRDKIEEEMVAKNTVGVSNDVHAFLPSINRQSTLSMGPSAMLSVSTPTLSMLAQPPEPLYISRSREDKRNRSLAVTLSINTDVNSVRRGGNVDMGGILIAGPPSQNQVVRAVRSHGRDTSDGFSTSDFASDWEAIHFNEDEDEECNIDDDADFYTEHFSSSHVHSEEQPIERMDDSDDISPDTPLLSHSPAIASSNASVSRRSSSARLSRANKILRSAHSRRSSLQRSLGRLSQRSSRTPNARTPNSKTSTGTTTSTETPVSDGRHSTLSAFGTSILGEDISEIPESPPPVPQVPSIVQESPPLHPPRAWTEISTIPSTSRSQIKSLRLHKPAGPRARRSSISGVISKSSSAESVHSRTSRNGRQDMLSVVEETSRSGSSVRSSSVEKRPSHDESEEMNLLRV